MEDTTTPQKPRFYLTSESKNCLKEIAKWTYFLSILGFFGIGVLIILAFYMGVIFSELDRTKGAIGMMASGNGGFMTAAYLVMALVYFFPVYYLYRFGKMAKKSFRTHNNDLLNESFLYLKAHYKFVGFLTVVLILLYVFAIVYWLTFQTYNY